MKKYLLFLFFFNNIIVFSQIPILKNKYKDLSLLSIDSCANIIKTLSLNYGNKKIISKDTLYFYTKNHQYDLYKDSLTLYYLTYLEPSNRNTEYIFQKDIAPKIPNQSITYNSIDEEIKIYEKRLKDYLYYEYRVKVPVSYNSFDLLLSIEKGDTIFCSYYNNNRIRAFDCKYDDVVFQLVYHKKIKPSYFGSIKMYYSDWMPRKTYYEKPKIPIKATTNNKLIWEKQTGLSYNIAIDYKLSDDPLRMSQILYKMKKVKGYNIKDILYDNIDSLENNISQQKIFYISCDTCQFYYYDYKIIDKDVIKVYLNNKILLSDTILGDKKNVALLLPKGISYLYIEALSEGDIEICTAYIMFEKDEFILSLTKGKVCKITIINKL